jgi:pimeloyl-ACP methyl ester carboxylesterase
MPKSMTHEIEPWDINPTGELSMRYPLYFVTAALAAGCDRANSESTAPDITPQLQTVVAPTRPRAATTSEKIIGGGGLSLTIYEDGTAGAPAIVFIHGFTQNFTTWDAQVSGLSGSFHLMSYDMRGHGASDKPLASEQYTESTLWADDLHAVIRSRSLQKPVVVGWSYGGFVIADYIRKYGDGALGGIVFVAASPQLGTQAGADLLTPEVLAIFGDVLSADVRVSLSGTHELTNLFTQHGTESWENMFGSAMMVPPQVRLAMFSRVLDNDAVLASIRVPTLVIHGSADRVVKLKAAEQIKRLVPGAKMLVYRGAGHLPHFDQPDRFNSDVAAFVASLP